MRSRITALAIGALTSVVLATLTRICIRCDSGRRRARLDGEQERIARALLATGRFRTCQL